MSLELGLSLYAALIVTYLLYYRVEHLLRHYQYGKWIEKEKATPLPPIEEVAGSVTLPYEVEDQETTVEDTDEREWRAELDYRNKKGL
jgi:hypothetical protein